ncbi:MAG: hypothetical protein R8G33_03135 [Gammaproteobacteria bacterium]|nr:hypothetical protein [Gammaproteobacteria bacterium]
MHNVTIEDLCSKLENKAKDTHFLDKSVEGMEHCADYFVKKFAEENGLAAHTLGALRWYFQSDDALVEDGLIELQCHVNPFTHKGHCGFQFVDVEEIDSKKKQ